MIEEVRLVPINGTLAVELRGELAGILALAEGAKAGSPATDLSLQIKMVAGIGFEPMTFRL